MDQTSYDIVPYESHPFPQSHPDRLAVIGRLFGLSPARVTRCRVLELGCASGGNLIPLAYHLPESVFVGVDLARRQVEAARKIIGELGLSNIRIEHASIADVDNSWGEFDYIICHGVYSWVSEEIQDRILDVASTHLSSHGIAYVSYNTYPGWHLREMIRHMMLFHATRFEEPGERVEQARALIDFLAGSATSLDSPYSLFLKGELDLVRKSQDWYLFHDHLEEFNKPCYFYQFAERADRHGLHYLGEADFFTMLTSGFSPDVQDTLERISPDIIHKEQYLDFVRNRHFRQTLLCRNNLVLDRNLGAEVVGGMLVSSAALPESTPVNLEAEVVATFRTSDGRTVETGSSLTKAALAILSENRPKALGLRELFRLASERVSSQINPEASRIQLDSELLATDLLWCYTVGALEFHTWQADFVLKANDRPKLGGLAAYQCRQGHPIVNPRHEVVSLDAAARYLLPVLDGRHDHESLLQHLISGVVDGRLTVTVDGNAVKDGEAIRSTLKRVLEQSLDGLARAALLVQ